MREEFFKNTGFGPPGKAFVNTVPIAVAWRQQSPLRAGASNPKDGFQEISTIVFLPDVNVLTSCQQSEYFLPLLIIKFDHRHLDSLHQMSTEPSVAFVHWFW